MPTPSTDNVTATIESVEALREIYRPPRAGARDKQIDHLDEHCRAFIAHSPFVVVGSADAEGNCDVSPKGGPAGFVKVLNDNELAIPDLSGNNRLDSMQNIVANAGIGLLFMIPGIDETLRVNGRASITTDADLLASTALGAKVPKVAIVVRVDEAFIHCAKAFRRGNVWAPQAWPETSEMPSIACMLRDHANAGDVPVDIIEAGLEESYRKTLWEVGGE